MTTLYSFLKNNFAYIYKYDNAIDIIKTQKGECSKLKHLITRTWTI